MPSNFKKLVQERMTKTGESWSTASRHVRAQVTPEPAPSPLSILQRVLPIHQLDEVPMEHPTVRTGVPALDYVLGGLPQGRITEIVAHNPDFANRLVGRLSDTVVLEKPSVRDLLMAVAKSEPKHLVVANFMEVPGPFDQELSVTLPKVQNFLAKMKPEVTVVFLMRPESSPKSLKFFSTLRFSIGGGVSRCMKNKINERQSVSVRIDDSGDLLN